MESFDKTVNFEENVHYELVPSAGENWDVRLLTDSFPETVIAFKELKVAEDAEHMTFNFEIVSTPDPDLTDESLELQQYLANVLSNILENAVQKVEAPEDAT